MAAAAGPVSATGPGLPPSVTIQSALTRAHSGRRSRVRMSRVWGAGKKDIGAARPVLLALLAVCLLLVALYFPPAAKVERAQQLNVKVSAIRKPKGRKIPAPVLPQSSPLHVLDGVPALNTQHPGVVEYTLVIPPHAQWAGQQRGPRMQHAATLAEVGRGEVLASWFGGSWEGRPDTAVYSARYRGGKWSEHSRVTASQGPHWNPVLCAKPGAAETLLFLKHGVNYAQWRGLVVRSRDGGRTWGAPAGLASLKARARGIVGPAKNKCLFTRDGTMLGGTSQELHRTRGKPYDGVKQWSVHIEYSSDGGRSWGRTPAIPFKGNIIQPTLFLDSAGKVRMLARQRGRATGTGESATQSGRIVLAKSNSTNGVSGWAPFRETTLPCPNSGLDAVRLADGRILVIYNHSNRMGTWGRTVINAALSYDDGESWRPVMTLDESPTVKKEFSYPAVIQASDGRVHIAYTYSSKMLVSGKSGRDNIRHVILDPSRLDLDYWRAVKLGGEHLAHVGGGAVVTPASGVGVPPPVQPWEAARRQL
eukprot:jgi/Tetstr1/449457/TSEL_036552.t1